MTVETQEPTFAPGYGPDGPKAGGGSESAQQDFFGFSRTEKYMLPDGVSYIEIQALNEGAKKDFQDKTSRDLVIGRNQEARMTILQGAERHELIRASMVGWNLKRGGTPVPFEKVHVNDFLKLADPRIVEDLEKAVRKLNPWLLQDMKAEDIRKEIANLEEMLAEAEKREAGEGS